MSRVYAGVYKLSRNETAPAMVLALAVVLAYSFWGAHVLHTQANAATPTVATSQQ